MTRSTTPTPTKGRRARRREARRRQILSAAMDIVVSEGIDALTMPGIASEIDAAVGGLYRYFPSKDHLVVALEMWAVEAFGEHLRSRLDQPVRADDPVVSALASVWRAFDSWFSFAAEEPAHHRLMDTLISVPANVLDDASDAQVQEHVQPIVEVCAETLQAAADLGALSPGDAIVRTHVLWGTLHGLGHFRKMDRRRPEELHADALRDHAVHALLRGWGAPPDLLGAAREAAHV